MIEPNATIIPKSYDVDLASLLLYKSSNLKSIQISRKLHSNAGHSTKKGENKPDNVTYINAGNSVGFPNKLNWFTKKFNNKA